MNLSGTRSEGNEFLAAAIEYAAQGWSIIPIKAGGEKKPAVAWKEFQAIRPTVGQLREWFSKLDLDGLAVITGDVSGGLCCRDFDKAGAYEAWAAGHPDLASMLPTVKTGRGHHVYFRCAGQKTEAMPDGELRGEKVYTLLPPSRHPTGVRYQWIVPLPDGPVPAVDPVQAGLLTDAMSQVLGVSGSVSLGVSGSQSSLVSLSISDPRVQDAIRRTLPCESGYRNRLIFSYVRRLKALPELEGHPAPAIKPYVAEWFQAARPVIATQDFDTTWADASYAWSRVKHPFGTGPLDLVVAAAESRPPTGVALQYSNPSIRLLIGVCAQLQQLAGTEPFYLAVRAAADCIDVDRTTAGKFLGMLVIDKVLEECRKGTYHDRKATRWRFTERSDGQ